MARSSRIYIVVRAGSLAPLAAFTVKHECIAWLDRSSHNWVPWSVITMHDNQPIEGCRVETIEAFRERGNRK